MERKTKVKQLAQNVEIERCKFFMRNATFAVMGHLQLPTLSHFFRNSTSCTNHRHMLFQTHSL